MVEITLTAENFSDEVLKSELPVLIDFWATWCGPCTMQSPVLSEVATEYDGKLKVCKVNVDEQRELALNFGIESIPTLVFMNGEKIADVAVGFRNKDELCKLLSKNFGL